MFYFFNQETVPTDTRVRKNFHQLWNFLWLIVLESYACMGKADRQRDQAASHSGASYWTAQ